MECVECGYKTRIGYIYVVVILSQDASVAIRKSFAGCEHYSHQSGLCTRGLRKVMCPGTVGDVGHESVL